MADEGTRSLMLHQRWVHAHEEDTATEMVFRLSTYEFGPSRGRESLELKGNGSLVEGRIGPTDRMEEVEGNWELSPDGESLTLYRSGEPQPSRVLKIASLEADRLVVRKERP
jgi:hypothetical protein